MPQPDVYQLDENTAFGSNQIPMFQDKVIPASGSSYDPSSDGWTPNTDDSTLTGAQQALSDIRSQFSGGNPGQAGYYVNQLFQNPQFLAKWESMYPGTSQNIRQGLGVEMNQWRNNDGPLKTAAPAIMTLAGGALGSYLGAGADAAAFEGGAHLGGGASTAGAGAGAASGEVPTLQQYFENAPTQAPGANTAPSAQSAPATQTQAPALQDMPANYWNSGAARSVPSMWDVQPAPAQVLDPTGLGRGATSDINFQNLGNQPTLDQQLQQILDTSQVPSASNGIQVAQAGNTMTDVSPGINTAPTDAASLGSGLRAGTTTGAVGGGDLGTGLTPGTPAGNIGGGSLGSGLTTAGIGAGALGTLGAGSLAGENLSPVIGGASAAAASGLPGQGGGGSGGGSGTGGGSAVWNRIMDGTATAGDWASIAGNLAPGVLGLIGSNQQTSAYKDLANQYMGMGAPYRQRLSDLYANPSSFLTSPEVQTSVQQGSDALARSLSVNGNPAGNPAAMSAIQNYSANTLFGKLGQEKDRLAGFGGLTAYNAAAPATNNAAITSQGHSWNAAGYGLGQALNPQPTLAQYFQQLSQPRSMSAA